MQNIRRQRKKRIPTIEQRIFITADPAIPTYYTMESPVVLSGDFDLSFLFSTSATSTLLMIFGRSDATSDFVLVNGDTGKIDVRLGGQNLSSAATYNDGFLHHGLVSVRSGVATIYVDDASDGSGAASLPTTLDRVGSNQFGNYFKGIIANPTITDFSNPSNSESWKLDQPYPINTEQSSSGNNLLTYVGSTEATRELYTLNEAGTQWDGEDGGVLVIA